MSGLQRTIDPRRRTINVTLPTLFDDQAALHALTLEHRFVAGRCGRRYGKTELGVCIGADDACRGRYVGWFAPEYKFIAEAYREFDRILHPIKLSSSKDGVYQTRTGGRIDFWSLENENAGRSRKYHRIIIDEAAFTKANMLDIWERNLRPTLLDYAGSALVLSNTNGSDPQNFLWQVCHEERLGFVQHHAPTHKNPHLPVEELARLQAENHPLVYRQEYLAEFVDWSGEAFFALPSLLLNGEPVEPPKSCDAVFAVIDTATKTGTDNDGTGVLYCALNTRGSTHQLTLLDWELRQIEGADLETWLPTVVSTLETYASACGARSGSLGAFIEDKSSGMVLLQQAARRGLNARPIDSKLTAVGKDERAISVSGYVYRGAVKLARTAYERVTTYKRVTRCHLVGQVTGFRVGDKDAAKRADDLLDTFCYAVALSLGDAGGF